MGMCPGIQKLRKNTILRKESIPMEGYTETQGPRNHITLDRKHPQQRQYSSQEWISPAELRS